MDYGINDLSLLNVMHGVVLIVSSRIKQNTKKIAWMINILNEQLYLHFFFRMPGEVGEWLKPIVC